MATLPAGFDASQVPEMNFDALPEGQYVAIATASEMKPTKNGQGQYLQFTFEVLDGPFKGRKLWSRLNLQNSNQTAVEIAQRELAAFCRAAGVITPKDSGELHNRPVLISVAVEKDDRNREGNTIKKYESLGGASPTQMPQAQAGAQPTTAAPWQASGAAAQAKAPWQK